MDIEILDPQPVEDSPVETEVAEPAGEAENPEPAASDPEDVPLTDEEHAQRERKKTGSQRAREALAREREARARIEGELAALKAQMGGKQPTQEAPKAAGKPTADQFQTYEDYLEALADYKAEQKVVARLEAENRKRSEEEAQRKQAERVTSWQTQQEAARAKYPDLDDVLSSTPQPGRLLTGALLKDSAGVEIAYHLAKDQTLLKKLDSILDPYELGLEMAALKNRIAPKSSTPSASKAPAPLKPVPSPSVATKDKGERYLVY